MELTQQQISAVKYYEGDVSGDDPFWGDAKAYITLNSLFYPGIDTERRRTAEGKRLNPAIITEPERLIDICANLITACRAADLSQPHTAYRVERYADYLDMRKAGRTLSFTSTSTGGFLPAYGDRIGIALLEFHIPAGIPCLPFSEVLHDDYAKLDEQEILLPPGLSLTFEEMPTTPAEQAIKDAEGNPPIVKCLVNAAATSIAAGYDHTLGEGEAPSAARIALQHSAAAARPEENQGLIAGCRVYRALNSGAQPDPKDVELYCVWKEAFKNEVLSVASR